LHDKVWHVSPSQQFAEQMKPEQAPQLPQEPQAQLPLQVRECCLKPGGQLPQDVLPVSTLPGAQPVSPEHEAQALQPPQPQLALQVRLRDWVPDEQFPQA
jgi:hypothetical protein